LFPEGTAADALVRDRYLLADDVDQVVATSAQRYDELTALGSGPLPAP
jgi:hypothetical protein